MPQDLELAVFAVTECLIHVESIRLDYSDNDTKPPLALRFLRENLTVIRDILTQTQEG
jgi:hypothetical protein